MPVTLAFRSTRTSLCRTCLGLNIRTVGTSPAAVSRSHSAGVPPPELLEQPEKEESAPKKSTSRTTARKRLTTISQDVTYTDNSSWSSPHDVVSRNAFAKDHVHLWTLLEACIQNNNLSRAESILVGLARIASNEDVALAINNYLLKLGELNPTDPQILRDWLKRIEKQVGKFRANSVTYAIMLKCMYTAGDTQGIRSLVMAQSDEELSGILSRVEVLGLEALRGIVEVSIKHC